MPAEKQAPCRRTNIKTRILISACLLGDKVRYDGLGKLLDDSRITQWRDEGRLIKACPEVLGGLPTPRPAAEIQQASGKPVLPARIRVETAEGADLSNAFVCGARAVLTLVQQHDIKFALLKSNSPSCANEYVYNGRFDGTLIRGLGVTTTLLRQHGVLVFNESHINELEKALD